MSPHGQRPDDPEERRALREAEASGLPFLVHADAGGRQVVVLLADGVERLAIGRRESSDVVLAWDDQVSRLHAQLERIGGEWTVEDASSRNGTYVNELRVRTRTRLRDGDILRAGTTRILFRDAEAGTSEPTAAGSHVARTPDLTPAQARVLRSLCAPCLDAPSLATPATNEEIAKDLFLTVDAVKAHLRELYRRFAIDALPQIQKRTALVRIAIESGIVRRDG